MRGSRAGDLEAEMKTLQLLQKTRFVSCVHGPWMLNHKPAAAARAQAGWQFLDFAVISGCSGHPKPLVANRINLTRRGICRGKISQRKNQITSNKIHIKRHYHE
jgi:hypothetical protein